MSTTCHMSDWSKCLRKFSFCPFDKDFRSGCQTDKTFGLTISQGALDNILRRTAQRLEPEAEAIRQTIQSSRVVGSDETGVRMDGQNYWQWVFQTPQASYYVIDDLSVSTRTFGMGVETDKKDESRGARVITDVMEAAVPEVWVSDLFSAQLKSPAPKHP